MKNIKRFLGLLPIFLFSLASAQAQPITEPTDNIFCAGPNLSVEITAVNHIILCNTLGSIEVDIQGALAIEWSDFTNQTLLSSSQIDANGNAFDLEAGVYTLRPFDAEGNSCIAQIEILDNCCPGDLNGDGLISSTDLSLFLGDFGTACQCPADMDGNGLVTAVDLSNFLAVFGTSCSTAGLVQPISDGPSALEYKFNSKGGVFTAEMANDQSIWLAIVGNQLLAAGEGNTFHYDGEWNSSIEIILVNEGNLNRLNLALEDRMAVYPNPASNFIEISIDDRRLEGEYQVKILNANGQEVYTNTINLNGPGQRLALNQLIQGNYILVLQNETKLISKRISIF